MALPNQNHHIATNKTALRAAEFQNILDRYGLSLDDAWNLVSLKHRGRHPVEYHKWVLDNMERIDAVADGDTATFLGLFDRWVTDVVRKDPTIVRLSYWKCHR